MPWADPIGISLEPTRKVILRDERVGHDSRCLEAYLDAKGALHVDGQDLGPATAIISDDGEYEWFTTIAAAHVPRLLALLSGQPSDDILDLLERHTGNRPYEVERPLHESDIPHEFTTW